MSELLTFDEIKARFPSEWVLIGDPQTVRRGIRELIAATQADELMITTSTFDPADRRRSFDLVAEVSG